MGCFDSSCNLTNVAISSGEEVFYVIFKKKPECLYYAQSDLWRFLMADKNTEALLIKTGNEELAYKSPIETFGYGTYDDYGQVEEVEGDYNDRVALYHKSATQEILGEIGTLEDVAELFVKQSLLRKELRCGALLGQQHFDNDEAKLFNKLLTSTRKLIKYKLSKWD